MPKEASKPLQSRCESTRCCKGSAECSGRAAWYNLHLLFQRFPNEVCHTVSNILLTSQASLDPPEFKPMSCRLMAEHSLEISLGFSTFLCLQLQKEPEQDAHLGT